MKKKLIIGEEPVPSASSGYNEKYYIERTFNRNIFIRQDILSDKIEEKFADLLANTELEFNQLCEQNPNKNVHWLVKNKSGEITWQQSKGNFQALRKYINAHKYQPYSPTDLEELLQQAKNQKVVIIADKAGMGKSTLLTHLSKRIKRKFPSSWLVRIDLNDNTELLEAQKGKKMDRGMVLEFISKKVLKLESHLEKQLFKESFEGKIISKVVVMVDGFDEISPNYKGTAIDMLHVLKQTSLEQLWVTTRPHLREDLEDNFLQLSYTLQPFSEFEQLQFLNKFWSENLSLKDINQNPLHNGAEALISKFAHSINDKDRQFTGIPLQARMLAEVFKDKFITFYLSDNSESELPQKLDLLELYKLLIDRKYDIYYEEKCKTPSCNVGIERLRQATFKPLQEKHQRLALEALFTDDLVSYLPTDSDFTFPDEDLAWIGIAHRNHEGKPQFIHRTFAEFYVADFLINQFKIKTENKHVQNFLLNGVLLRTDCGVIRAFLNGLLEKYTPTKEILQHWGKLLNEQWDEREVNVILVGLNTALHIAAAEDNASIIGFLLDSLKSGEYSNALTKMFSFTTWDMALENNSVQALKKIWEWAEVVTSSQIRRVPSEISEKGWVLVKAEQPNADELKNKLLLTKDRYGNTIWHRAVESCREQVLETLCSLAKKVGINTRELLFDKNKERKTAWQEAVDGNRVEILKKIWEWTKEAKMNQDWLKDKLLLAKDAYGETVWHREVKHSHLEALELLWIWAKEAKLNLHELLLARTYNAYTAWKIAAEEMKLETLKKIWEWAKEVKLNTDVLKNEMLLARDKYGYTVWDRAAKGGNLEALETFWIWAKEAELHPHELLLTRTDEGYKAWEMAPKEMQLEMLKKIGERAKEAKLNPDALKNNLLLSKDAYGDTAWHRAAKGGNLEVLETLWSCAKEAELNLHELLLTRSDNGYTALHMAAEEMQLEMLKEIWEWAKEVKLNTDELKKELLLSKDKYGRTVWHIAAYRGNLVALDTIWSWVREVELNTDDVRNKFFLAQNERGETVWNMTSRNHEGVFNKLWAWAKEVKLNPNELKNQLLLATDMDGNTALHRAAESGNLLELEILWSWAINTENLKDKLLLAKNSSDKTAWDLAARRYDIKVLEKLWGFAKEVNLNPSELKNKLLLATSYYGYTVWECVVQSGDFKALESLWSLAKQVEMNTEELKKLLLAKLRSGDIAWHVAAKEGNLEALRTLWRWAKEVKLNTEELKDNLLLAKGNYGYGLTAWEIAVQNNFIGMLEELWKLAKEVKLNPDELKNKLLLSKHEYGYTAWEKAAESGSSEVLETVWSWAKEVEMTTEELKDNLLLAKDRYGKTVWDIAAIKHYAQVLEKLWELAKEVKLNTEEEWNILLLIKHRYR